MFAAGRGALDRRDADLRLGPEGQLSQKPLERGLLYRGQRSEEVPLLLQVPGIHLVDEFQALRSERHHPPSGVAGLLFTRHETGADESIHAFRGGAGRDHGVLGDLPLRKRERPPGPSKGAHHVELALADAVRPVVVRQHSCERVGESAHPADHGHGTRIDVRALTIPLFDHPCDTIRFIHVATIVSVEAIVVSMEIILRSIRRLWRPLRWPLIVAVAPVAFGSTYWVTREFLPLDSPLWGSAIRALPAGIVLLLVARQLPRGAWWWRAAILGTLNMGLFFCLVYIAAQMLPSSVAASICSVTPLMIAGSAWLIVRERPSSRVLVGAATGAVGVLLIVGTSTGSLNAWGVVASIVAMALSSVGAVLTRRWDDGTPILTVTAWQLLVGGLELTGLALLFEGAPPQLDAAQLVAFAHVSLVATALAFFCWFSGFRHLPAGVVGVIGLLNPITGVAVGVLLGAESLSTLQTLGIGLVLGSIVFVNIRRGRAASALTVPDRILDSEEASYR